MLSSVTFKAVRFNLSISTSDSTWKRKLKEEKSLISLRTSLAIIPKITDLHSVSLFVDPPSLGLPELGDQMFLVLLPFLRFVQPFVRRFLEQDEVGGRDGFGDGTHSNQVRFDQLDLVGRLVADGQVGFHVRAGTDAFHRFGLV